MKRFLSAHTSVHIVLWPSLLAALTLAITVDAVTVRGPSMEPALADNQTVFVNRLAYGLRLPAGMGYLVTWGTPRSGELVVFEHPRAGRLAVKRCLLAPGDAVRVTRERLYAEDDSWRVTPEIVSQLTGRDRIPEGYVFVLGENPAASSDSRDFGLVPMSVVHGRVLGWRPSAERSPAES
jgi:signal peptidase I